MIIDNVFYSFDANGYMTDQNASDSDLTFGSKIALMRLSLSEIHMFTAEPA